MAPRREFVLGFVFDPCDAQVALVWKKRPSWQAGRANGVGGKVEAGELPAAAMRREFREETGLDVLEERWRPFARFATFDRGAPTEECLMHLFETRSSDVWSVRGEPKKNDEVVGLFSVDDLLDGSYCPQILPNVRWMVAMAVFSRGELGLEISQLNESARTE